ncbi:MAG: hypothetical protein HYX32_08765 [Actinobacteria bacterium]|nr:hypothetical protein [Actinomycetota bacterium]
MLIGSSHGVPSWHVAQREGVQRAIALLTVALADDDTEPDGAVVEAVAPDLHDADATEELIRGLAEVSAWMLMHLEELSGEEPSIWLRRAALDFA